jgi:hypothetical protein
MHRKAALKLLVEVPDEPEAAEPVEAAPAENPLLS